MSDGYPRIKREKRTIKAMVKIYCNAKHEAEGELCPECTEFLYYAKMRLDKCPFGEKKSACGRCLVHCYVPEMREKAKRVMRYSGPKMPLHYPILALHHIWDRRKKASKLAGKNLQQRAQNS